MMKSLLAVILERATADALATPEAQECLNAYLSAGARVNTRAGRAAEAKWLVTYFDILHEGTTPSPAQAQSLLLPARRALRAWLHTNGPRPEAERLAQCNAKVQQLRKLLADTAVRCQNTCPCSECACETAGACVPTSSRTWGPPPAACTCCEYGCGGSDCLQDGCPGCAICFPDVYPGVTQEVIAAMQAAIDEAAHALTAPVGPPPHIEGPDDHEKLLALPKNARLDALLASEELIPTPATEQRHQMSSWEASVYTALQRFLSPHSASLARTTVANNKIENLKRVSDQFGTLHSARVRSSNSSTIYTVTLLTRGGHPDFASDDEVADLTPTCSCPAALKTGWCKHSGALAYLLASNPDLR